MEQSSHNGTTSPLVCLVSNIILYEQGSGKRKRGERIPLAVCWLGSQSVSQDLRKRTAYFWTFWVTRKQTFYFGLHGRRAGDFSTVSTWDCFRQAAKTTCLDYCMGTVERVQCECSTIQTTGNRPGPTFTSRTSMTRPVFMRFQK